MSKMDDMRALREARYEQTAARDAQPGADPRPAPRRPVRPAEARSSSAIPEPVAAQACGHRSMNGRTCTREQGHAAKSHRYS